MIPNKLPQVPDKMFNTPCNIKFFASKLSEDGERTVIADVDTMCIYGDKAKSIMDAEKRIVQLEGSIMVKGDIANELSISDGIVAVRGKQLKIYKVMRAMNPDGSVHHTTMELM